MSNKYAYMKSIYICVELKMQSVLGITETRVRNTRGNLFFPPSRVWLKWRELSATVGLIASPLSHPAGLACNEMKAFGWNDLSHPLSSHLLVRARPDSWMRGVWGCWRGGWPVGRQRRWENCFSIAEVISINVELHVWIPSKANN